MRVRICTLHALIASMLPDVSDYTGAYLISVYLFRHRTKNLDLVQAPFLIKIFLDFCSKCSLVTPAGIEPSILTLKGLRPSRIRRWSQNIGACHSFKPRSGSYHPTPISSGMRKEFLQCHSRRYLSLSGV